MADYCNLNTSSSNVVIFAGGSYNNHDRNRGILYQYNTSTSNTNGNIGAHTLSIITGFPRRSLSRTTW